MTVIANSLDNLFGADEQRWRRIEPERFSQSGH
jgi:hypothetical protein